MGVCHTTCAKDVRSIAQWLEFDRARQISA
jgi:hypothetical protein